MVRKTFSGKERLKRREVSLVFSSGRRARSLDYLGIYKKNCLPYGRLAVSVKRKIGNAVCRNYERRLVKEVFRSCKEALLGIDVLVVKLSDSNLGYEAKKESLTSLFLEISSRVCV